MKRINNSVLFSSLVTAPLLPFMILIVSGLSIYLVNRNEINFSLTEITLPILGFSTGISVILFLILWLVRKHSTTLNIIIGLFAGLSAAVWVQSQLLVWNLGQFNGQKIPWENFKTNMLIDGAVWAVIIGGSVFGFIKGKQKFKKAFLTGIYFLGFLSIFLSFLNAPPKLVNHTVVPESKDIFTFHPENNVLVIILDDFQSDYFEFIAENHPREIRELDGFTFYRNTISRYPTTKASIPSILTGVLYKNDKTYTDYIQTSLKQFYLIQAFKDRSYSTIFAGHTKSSFPDFFPMEKAIVENNKAFSNSTLEYLDYAAFRAFPTFLKSTIFNNGNWFFTFMFRREYPPREHGVDIRFLELLEKNASISKDKKGSFKLLHFFIPHPPLRVDENLKFDSTLTEAMGYLKQTRGAMKLASRILITLKHLGIYDQSEIVIMSDHGANLGCFSHRETLYNTITSSIPPDLHSSSLALLLYKPKNSKGDLKKSDIPLEITDLACLLGVNKDDSSCRGYTLASSCGTRERTFYFYRWAHKYWWDHHLPPITEYVVTGPAYRAESFSPGKFIYTSKGIEKIVASPRSAPYTLGKTILFTLDGHGEATPYLKGGWSTPESYNLWSIGPVAGLSFQLEKAPEKDISLRLLCFGYISPKKKDGQDVAVIVNGVTVNHWLVNGNKWYEAVIPKSIIPDSTINIVFDISNPLSPDDSKDAKNRRKVGIAARKMVLEEIK